MQSIIRLNAKHNKGGAGAVHVRSRLIPAFATVAPESVFWGQSPRIRKVEPGNLDLESGLWNKKPGIRNLE